MEGLEMGGERTWGAPQDASQGTAPPVRRRWCWGLPGLVTLPRGCSAAEIALQCFSSSSSAAGMEQLGALPEHVPPAPTAPRLCRGGWEVAL